MITMRILSSINKLLVACLIFGLPILGEAQGNRNPDVKAKVIMWADFDCFTSKYPKGRLDKVVKLAIEQDGYPGAKVWGDRAFAFDLDSDRKPEYIIPLTCSAVGNCAWGIFSVNPARLLGVVHGADVYIRQRIGRWSAITVYIHNSCCDGFLDTYTFKNRRYRKLAGEYYVTGNYGLPGFGKTGHPYPKFMDISSPCKPKGSE
jgi:hypothetical protein